MDFVNARQMIDKNGRNPSQIHQFLGFLRLTSRALMNEFSGTVSPRQVAPDGCCSSKVAATVTECDPRRPGCSATPAKRSLQAKMETKRMQKDSTGAGTVCGGGPQDFGFVSPCSAPGTGPLRGVVVGTSNSCLPTAAHATSNTRTLAKAIVI